MPLIPEDDVPVMGRFGGGVVEKDPFAPRSENSVIGAGFRLENDAYAMAQRLMRPEYVAEPGFEPFSKIRGTRYEMDNLESFIDVRSESEMRAVMARIDQENMDKKTLADAGGWGIAAAIAAGLASPTTVLPLAPLARGVTGAISVGRTAALTGAGAALQAGVSEVALRANQETRTNMDSAVNIGSAAILGGLIGGGAAALMTRAEHQALIAALDADRVTMRDASAGAAQSDLRTGKAVSYGLDKIPVVGDLLNKASPNTRVLFSDNLPARTAYLDLVEVPLRTEDNLVGLPSTFGGAPVSRIVSDERTRMRLVTDDIVTKAFTEYAGIDGQRFALERAAFADMTGQAGERMSHKAFSEEVGRALFSGDASVTPQAAAAAKELRETVLEPLRVRLVEAKLLDEDAAPRNDPSWFYRMPNTEKIAAERPTIKAKITDWYESEQARKLATQERMATLGAQLDKIDDALSKLDAMQARLDARIQRTEGALNERKQEAGRTAARAGATESAAIRAGEAETEIAEFIDAMRKQNIPAIRERLDALEADYRRYSALEQRSQVSEAAVAKALDDEFKSILDGTPQLKEAVEMLTGRRKRPVVPSMLALVAREGGITDAVLTGEIRTLRESSRLPGLINKNGRSADQWAERFSELAEAAGFPNVKLTAAEAIEVLQDAASGATPPWWRELNRSPLRDAADMADVLADDIARVGGDPSDIGDIRSYFQREERSPQRMGPDGADPGIPPSMLRESTGEGLDRARAELNKVKASVRDAMNARGRGEAVANARAGEAGLNADANARRLAVVSDRAIANQAKREMLADARAINEAAEADALAKIETELKAWGGKSADDALTAIKAREKVAADRAPDAPRLRSADRAVRNASERVLGSDQRLTRAELDSRADETIDRWVGGPAGRLPYDVGGGSASRAAGVAADEFGQLRGSLRSRDFAIPTKLIEDFVETDVNHVMAAVGRTLIPDLELVKRFGDVDMTDAIRRINEDAAARIDKAATAKERTAIGKERDMVLRDLTAQRDRVRGMYGYMADPKVATSNFARFVNISKGYGNMTFLGTAGLNSMPDAAGIVFRYGLENTLRAGWVPFLKGLMSDDTLRGAQKQQLRAMNIGLEAHLNLRGSSIADVADNYRPGSKFERSVSWMADKSQILNLQAPWTDMQKTISGGVIMDSILRMANNVALGKATQKEIAALAEANIDATMARRMHDAFSNGGGEIIDGVRAPNTASWTDKEAARMLSYAVQREADIAVVTPGLEKPLFMDRATGSLMMMFKSFTAAAHQRLLIANLQKADFNTLQGLFVSVALGALSYRLYTAVSGQPASDRPQDWVKEGISRSGVMGWLEEANSMAAKTTGGRADIYRMIGADRELSRMQSRSALSGAFGPMFGQAEKALGVVNAVGTGNWSGQTTNDVRKLLPFQNLWALRLALDEAEKGINNAIDVPQRPEPQPPRRLN